MNLSPAQIRILERVVNAFETGSADGNYADISVFHDGPDDRRQITYGRSQTTEYSHLAELVKRYCDDPRADSKYVFPLRPYLPRIGREPLVDDLDFRQYLRAAAVSDAVMRQVQDDFFRDAYLNPALKWATQEGFTLALSGLVIYDSFVHSGSIRMDLRLRFPEFTPAHGGDEKTWVEQYVHVRREWLANHRRVILHSTVYRCDCFLREIARQNWDLHLLPIRANGVAVS